MKIVRSPSNRSYPIVLRNFDFTILSFEKERSHEQLVTGITTNYLIALKKLLNMAALSEL